MTMSQRTFEHVKTINIPDPEFMPIYLRPCGNDHIIALQKWGAWLLNVETEKLTRVDYPPWAWNVSSANGPDPALTIYFERPRALKLCPIDVTSGKISVGELISDSVGFPSPHPPNLVTGDGIWFAHSGEKHSLVAAYHSRVTDLSDDISRITSTDFFISGPDGKVYLHRWDVGLLETHPVDQPAMIINYRIIGCREPRGVAFDDEGKIWILDEAGPALFENDLDGKVHVHDISQLHRESDDLTDPSPYPWHSCIWSKGSLVVGCCDAARMDILRPVKKDA